MNEPACPRCAEPRSSAGWLHHQCPGPPTDPRQAKTLDEAARNPDGTYNAYRAMSWMSEALHPGAGIPEAEVRRIAAKVQEFKQCGGNLDELACLIADKRQEILLGPQQLGADR